MCSLFFLLHNHRMDLPPSTFFHNLQLCIKDKSSFSLEQLSLLALSSPSRKPNNMFQKLLYRDLFLFISFLQIVLRFLP